MSIREEVLAFMREYYDVGHIVGLNADVMANKLADRLEKSWSTLTNEQLSDAILVMETTIRHTAPDAERFSELCQHLTDLLNVQKARANGNAKN